jgi:hypothetical protein
MLLALNSAVFFKLSLLRFTFVSHGFYLGRKRFEIKQAPSVTATSRHTV